MKLIISKNTKKIVIFFIVIDYIYFFTINLELKMSKSESEEKLSTQAKTNDKVRTPLRPKQRLPVPTLNQVCQLKITNATTPGGTLDFTITYGLNLGSHEIAYPMSVYPTFELDGTDLECYNNAINPNADPIDVEFV